MPTIRNLVKKPCGPPLRTNPLEPFRPAAKIIYVIEFDCKSTQ